jgi:hypothetical protein
MNDRKKTDKKHSSEESFVDHVLRLLEQTVKTGDLTKHVQPGKAESFVDHTLRLLEPKSVECKKKEVS